MPRHGTQCPVEAVTIGHDQEIQRLLAAIDRIIARGAKLGTAAVRFPFGTAQLCLDEPIPPIARFGVLSIAGYESAAEEENDADRILHVLPTIRGLRELVRAMTKRQDDGDGNDRFESLYTRYYARMLRFFRQVFRVSDADAQELTQDSFVRFYKAMDEYRGQAEWALLETIARNVGYNKVRSVNTIKRGSVRPESLDDAESGNDAIDKTTRHPIETMIETERLQRLRKAMTELPSGQRQCLQLWLEDFSSEEISRALRISIVAVKSRIRDAKRTLRERLGDEGALPEDES